MNKYLFSIICPCYNSECFIDRLLKSVIKQNYGNWELILVDDGSTDNTSNIIKKYKTEKIKVISQSNKGALAARLVGLSAARGDYVLFVDSDDEIFDNYLLLANNYINSFNCDICCFGMIKEESLKFEEKYQRLPDETLLNSNYDIMVMGYVDVKLFEGLIPKVFRRSLLTNCKSVFNLRKGEDYIQSFEFMKNAKSLLSVNKIVYIYHENKGSLSHNWNQKNEYDYIFTCRKYIFNELCKIQTIKDSDKEKFLIETNNNLSFFIRRLFKDKTLSFSEKKKISRNVYEQNFYKILKKEIKNIPHLIPRLFLKLFNCKLLLSVNVLAKIVHY